MLPLSRRHALALSLGFLLAPALPAWAQNQAARPAPDPELQAMIAKNNAYIGLLNRALRISQSWDRYLQWVNLRTGPTGRERYIDYGVYETYDTRGELKAAREAATKPPAMAELDAAVLRFATAVETVSPIINQMSGYYERKDYRDDKMAEGKALHAKLLPAIDDYIKTRRAVEAAMEPFKAEIDRRELAAIEAAEGRRTRWHNKMVMMSAARLVDQLPTNAKPVVAMPAFDAAMADFAGAVRALDTWLRENPGESSSIASQARGLVGDMRDLQDKLAKAKGDFRAVVRRDPMMGSMGLSMLVSKYNSMVTFAR
jgi:hypothetical protein